MTKIIRMNVDEFEKESGCLVDVVKVLDDDVEYVYINEDEECPYTGCKYVNDTYSICGVGMDCKVDFETMIDMLMTN